MIWGLRPSSAGVMKRRIHSSILIPSTPVYRIDSVRWIHVTRQYLISPESFLLQLRTILCELLSFKVCGGLYPLAACADLILLQQLIELDFSQFMLPFRFLGTAMDSAVFRPLAH